MWKQGVLADSTLYWQDGMTDWRPLREYFGASVAPAVPPPLTTPLRSSRFSFTKDPTTLTAFVKTMVWISLVVGVISLFSDFAQLSLASSGSISTAAAESNDARQQMIGIVVMLTFIVTGIAFLKWIHRANLNSRGFGATDMKFTPGWSVGYYFIPFLNLVRPYQAMKEIWQVSQNPADWKHQSGSALLGWWWTLWLLSGFFGQLYFRLSMHVNSPSTLEAATMASIASAIVDIPLCIVAVTLISTIYRRQKTLVEQSA
jgi:hypothetical protein